MTKLNNLIGRRYTSGKPGTPEHDTGVVTKVEKKSGRIFIEWEVAKTGYWEYPDDKEISLQPVGS